MPNKRGALLPEVPLTAHIQLGGNKDCLCVGTGTSLPIRQLHLHLCNDASMHAFPSANELVPLRLVHCRQHHTSSMLCGVHVCVRSCTSCHMLMTQATVRRCLQIWVHTQVHQMRIPALRDALSSFSGIHILKTGPAGELKDA